MGKAAVASNVLLVIASTVYAYTIRYTLNDSGDDEALNVSGHRRTHACKSINKTEIPCIIRDMSDEEAPIVMVDSNMTQREHMLPSERARAYKMKLDALKNSVKRNRVGTEKLCSHRRWLLSNRCF